MLCYMTIRNDLSGHLSPTTSFRLFMLEIPTGHAYQTNFARKMRVWCGWTLWQHAHWTWKYHQGTNMHHSALWKTFLTICVINVQQQKLGDSCGLFAIAMALDICDGRDPFLNSYSEVEMRFHLEKCFKSKFLTKFLEDSIWVLEADWRKECTK